METKWFWIRLSVLANLLFTIFVLLTKSSMVLAGGSACQKSLNTSEFVLDLSDHFLQEHFKFEPRFSKEKVERTLRYLVSLSPDEQSRIGTMLREKDFTDLSGTVAETLLLGVYDRQAWRDYLQKEIGNIVNNTPQWWNRGYLFENMPATLQRMLLEDLRTEIKEASSRERAKRASRILTSLRIIFERPDLELLHGIRNNPDLHVEIEKYFSRFQNEVSHYRNDSPITVANWVRLIQVLHRHFQTSKNFQNLDPVYWFGSIPNGRGKKSSDFDFSSQFNFSVKQTEELTSYLLREAKGIISGDTVSGFDMKTVEYMAGNLLFMSPLSVLFEKDKLYLVVRELEPPDQPWDSAFGDAISFRRLKVRLHHFPIEIDESGRLHLLKSLPEFIKDY